VIALGPSIGQNVFWSRPGGRVAVAQTYTPTPPASRAMAVRTTAPMSFGPSPLRVLRDFVRCGAIWFLWNKVIDLAVAFDGILESAVNGGNFSLQKVLHGFDLSIKVLSEERLRKVGVHPNALHDPRLIKSSRCRGRSGLTIARPIFR